MTDEESRPSTEIFAIPEPTVTFLPETDPAHPTVLLEPYHVDLLPEYDYISQEYLISGAAQGHSYCTRLLLRRPADPARFSGFVVAEPSHLWGGTSIWRHVNRWVMRHDHAWLEIDSQAPSAIGKLKNVDPERYAAMAFTPGPTYDEFSDNIPVEDGSEEETLSKEQLWQAYDAFKAKWWPATTQSPEILTAASHALRAGLLGGLTARWVVLSGLSQTGGLTRRFITHSGHLRLPDGETAPFDGFLPCQSGGTTPLPDCVSGGKIIELLGESEFLSVRYPCGVSGQMHWERTAHRRPQSEGYRLYEVAGMGHRESRYYSAVDRESGKGEGEGVRWSTVANSFVYHAVFEAMRRWIVEGGDGGFTPPDSVWIRTVGETDEIVRDRFGNALDGVRTLHTEVPVARIVAATPRGRPNWYCGSEWPFTEEELRALYGSVAAYRRRAGAAIARQMKLSFLLPEDAEVLRRETVERVHFWKERNA
ncbi:uncharacterized protein BO95DRAFT_492330 [Aspergillus brunneoviolaceus CBS 621.78]|uniref:Uncharacterized protein n=1 Tax=Aspergillus brunneoviolaceus CBS 621.78 TaxID=1450534 RepID=A0ACD1GP69_9EURO|nr:hypothetical protein BO95DRAFT_492330 [Aspergillus brunneoviolaceus CBS 621.78]RAH51164.1 hypothetical protein BO95DRAFT_492330 [Aspergillus brunneoviolaceus CBS 621.78]